MSLIRKTQNSCITFVANWANPIHSQVHSGWRCQLWREWLRSSWGPAWGTPLKHCLATNNKSTLNSSTILIIGLHKCAQPRRLDKKYHRWWKGCKSCCETIVVVLVVVVVRMFLLILEYFCWSRSKCSAPTKSLQDRGRKILCSSF